MTITAQDDPDLQHPAPRAVHAIRTSAQIARLLPSASDEEVAKGSERIVELLTDAAADMSTDTLTTEFRELSRRTVWTPRRRTRRPV